MNRYTTAIIDHLQPTRSIVPILFINHLASEYWLWLEGFLSGCIFWPRIHISCPRLFLGKCTNSISFAWSYCNTGKSEPERNARAFRIRDWTIRSTEPIQSTTGSFAGLFLRPLSFKFKPDIPQLSSSFHHPKCHFYFPQPCHCHLMTFIGTRKSCGKPISCYLKIGEGEMWCHEWKKVISLLGCTCRKGGEIIHIWPVQICVLYKRMRTRINWLTE